MNIRKEHDYSALYAGIDHAICAELPQMELYCTFGRLICDRPEKGAAVATAVYFAQKYPEMSGVSPRNLRRMRDFYKIYAGVPELLDQAMLLGWTQNVMILEADLTLEERAWYLQAAGQFGWSKLELKKKIEGAAHLGATADIDKEEPVCYTNGEIENRTATQEVFGEIPGESSVGYGADLAASSEAQSLQISDRAVHGCRNGVFSFQKKTGSVRCLGDQLKPWFGPIMTGKQRYRLCHTQVGG